MVFFSAISLFSIDLESLPEGGTTGSEEHLRGEKSKNIQVTYGEGEKERKKVAIFFRMLCNDLNLSLLNSEK